MKTGKMMDKPALLIGLMIVGLLLGACETAVAPGGEEGKVLQSQVQRIQAPDVPAEDSSALAEGNKAFAFDLYRHLSTSSGNLFFSPYSVSTALAMTYGGARGRTADQMAQVLHFSLPQDRLHPAFDGLDLQLNRSSDPESKDDQPFQLSIANSLWGQQDYPFSSEYLDLLAQNYGAGMRLVDFITQAEAARQEINRWVSDKTQDRIKDLISQGGIDSASRLVLANAIYFKADWLNPFEKDNTSDQPFHLSDGSQVDVPTMSYSKAQTLPYLAGDGYQAVELPYVGDEVSMLLFVPDDGKLADLEKSFDASLLRQFQQSAQPTRLELFLPKFEFTSEYQLRDAMSEMGMPDAFCSGAPDFSGMVDSSKAKNLEATPLCIGGIFHKAFVKVDEKGTEAAAASAVVMEAMAIMGDQPVVLRVDRPFLFLILDKTTDTILFMGRIDNPKS